MRRMLVAAMLAIATMAGPVAGAQAARHHGSRATQAKHLVRSLAHAHGHRGREKALLRMMRALHINVVSRTGRPLAVSPELRAARGMYLYDIELRALAAAFKRHDTLTLDELAGRLTQGGLALGERFPPGLLRLGLVNAVRSSKRHPRHGSDLLPLVVRQLARRDGVDLARRPSARRIVLGPVAAWLVTADLAAPILRRLPARAADEPLAVPALARTATASASSVAGGCEKLDKAIEHVTKALDRAIDKAFGKSTDGRVKAWIAKHGEGKILGKVGEVLARKAKSTARWGLRKLAKKLGHRAFDAGKLLRKGGKAASLAAQIESLIHGSLLAYSVDVRELQDSLPDTHWGHDAPGRPLTFAVKVTMLDDYGELAVKCGKLAGMELPPKGPVEGVKIGWYQQQAELRPRHGTLDCGTVLCWSETGKDGIARLTFTPRREIVPGIGLERSDTGLMSAIALYQSKFDSGISGTIAQFLVPKDAGIRWTVAYHETPKLTLRLHSVSSGDFGSRGSAHAVLDAEVPLTIDEATGTITGRGTIDYTQFSYRDDGQVWECGGAEENRGTFSLDGIGTTPGTIAVDGLTIGDKPARRTTLRLHFPTLPTETYHERIVGGPCATDTTVTMPQWAVLFGAFAGGSLEDVLSIGGWTPGTGNVIARKTYGDGASFVAELQIVATPGS